MKILVVIALSLAIAPVALASYHDTEPAPAPKQQPTQKMPSQKMPAPTQEQPAPSGKGGGEIPRSGPESYYIGAATLAISYAYLRESRRGRPKNR